MKRMAAGLLARQARHADCNPRTAHEKNVEAERLALESEQLCDHLHGNEQMIEGLLHQINYLAKSPHKSRHRSLVITHLEDAYARLRMENGDPEPEAKVQTISPDAPVNGAAISKS